VFQVARKYLRSPKVTAGHAMWKDPRGTFEPLPRACDKTLFVSTEMAVACHGWACSITCVGVCTRVRIMIQETLDCPLGAKIFGLLSSGSCATSCVRSFLAPLPSIRIIPICGSVLGNVVLLLGGHQV